MWGCLIIMSRKDDHILLALKQKRDFNNGLDAIKLPYHALKTIDYDSVDISSCFLDSEIKVPILINAMSGGSPLAYEINKKLAQLANYFKIPIVTGSMNILLKDKSYIDSFRVIREYNPDGIVIMNINANTSVEEVFSLQKIMPVDGIEIHLNPIQELMMPEGDRCFEKRLFNIKNILNLGNVIIKDVGFGMSFETANLLYDLGVKYIDVSGKGGTDFSWIEQQRHSNVPELIFNDFGYNTYQSLINVQEFMHDITVIASGGIINSVDIVKCLVLGAEIVGMSYYFLDLVWNKSLEEAIFEFEKLLVDFKKIMALLGVRTIEELASVSYENRL